MPQVFNGIEVRWFRWCAPPIDASLCIEGLSCTRCMLWIVVLHKSMGIGRRKLRYLSYQPSFCSIAACEGSVISLWNGDGRPDLDCSVVLCRAALLWIWCQKGYRMDRRRVRFMSWRRSTVVSGGFSFLLSPPPPPPVLNNSLVGLVRITRSAHTQNLEAMTTNIFRLAKKIY